MTSRFHDGKPGAPRFENRECRLRAAPMSDDGESLAYSPGDHRGWKRRTVADSNLATRVAPLKTIQAVLERARSRTRIVVHPGIYRKTLELRHSGTAVPVVLEAEKAESVVLSRADVWTG